MTAYQQLSKEIYHNDAYSEEKMTVKPETEDIQLYHDFSQKLQLYLFQGPT